jgi:hypothetical protein
MMGAKRLGRRAGGLVVVAAIATVAAAVVAGACGGGSGVVSSPIGPDGGAGPGEPMGPSGKWDAEGCPKLFAQDLFPTFEVEISAADWAALMDEYANGPAREAAGLEVKPFHPTVFHYGDETVSDAAIRLRGNPTGSWKVAKMQFTVSFNESNRDGRFHGLRKLDFDAPFYDPSFLRNRLALSYLRDLGLPAGCANNARLVVNGAYYGVYASMEHLDKEFLQRVFPGASDGDLWKGFYEKKTNESVMDWSRISRLLGTTDYAGMSGLVDLDEAIYDWAAEAMMPDDDGYWSVNHNLHLYDHPQRGFLWISSDLDATFDFAEEEPDPVFRWPWWSTGPGAHFVAVMNDLDGRARYLSALRAAYQGYDVAKLHGRIDTWSAQIAGAIAEDPNKDFRGDSTEDTLHDLREAIEHQKAFMGRYLDCQDSGSGADADGDGAIWCRDCNDADAAVHPGAPEVCGNMADDNCDLRRDEGCAAGMP